MNKMNQGKILVDYTNEITDKLINSFTIFEMELIIRSVRINVKEFALKKLSELSEQKEQIIELSQRIENIEW